MKAVLEQGDVRTDMKSRNRRAARIWKTCVRCGKSFWVMPSDKAQQYHRASCARADRRKR